MCVIMVASRVRPTEEMVARAFDHNKDGVGIAWRQGDEVAWKKGIMSLEEAQQVCRDTPLPYVVHFRVASVGGVKQTLTHPFLIGKEASLALEGTTKGAVLFHNGHWNGWNEKAVDAAIHSNNKVPLGDDWSDTRAMAFMIHIYGPGLMNLLTSQKGVIFRPRKFDVFVGTSGWDKINDVWCSNDYFWKGGRSHHSGGNTTGSFRRFCSVGRCPKQAQEGKEVCETCEKERDARVVAAAEKTANADPVKLVTGGTPRPLARTFTLSEIESLHRGKKISKSQYKKYRKNDSLLGKVHKGSNREARAKKALAALSMQIAEKLLGGTA